MADVSNRSISIVIHGKAYNGSYSISGSLLAVSYGGKTATARLETIPPETLAHMMLGEIVAHSPH